MIQGVGGKRSAVTRDRDQGCHARVWPGLKRGQRSVRRAPRCSMRARTLQAERVCVFRQLDSTYNGDLNR